MRMINDKRSTEEIERQLLLLQLNKESRSWWKKQGPLAITISIISAAIAVWSFYDSHTSIDRQADAARLEMQQLRIDLNMTAHDSVILTRNDQLHRAEVELLLKEKDKSQLAEALVSLRRSAARERMRIYATVDSLMRRKDYIPDSTELKLRDQHIQALERLLSLASSGAPGLAELSMQARHEFTYVSGAQMREYWALQELAATKERLQKAEMERCP